MTSLKYSILFAYFSSKEFVLPLTIIATIVCETRP